MTDFESTTEILARRAPGFAWLPAGLRKELTPKVVWSAVVVLAIAIGYVIDAQHRLNEAQAAIGHQAESISGLQKQGDTLNEIKTQLAVVNSKVDGIADEVERQREWRERIEGIAEAPPHARYRR